MKRMVLGLLVLSLFSFSPVFAGKVADDASVNGDAETEGVAGVKNVKNTIQASNEMEKDIETNLDKSETFGDATKTSPEE